MTESEWLACDNPDLMIESAIAAQISSRKLRLFACACVSTIWHLLEDERSRNAVLTAEQFADGVATVRELEEARDAAQAAVRDASLAASWAAVHAASCGVAQAASRNALWEALWAASQAAAQAALRDASLAATGAAIRAAHCGLLRCVFGNPFRQVAVDPGWLTPTVVRLARGIYEGREFDCLPILGDALEDAGCTDEMLLGHCRSAGPHARGCWVVDLLLGRG
jgi:hypothetical protein